MDFENIYNLQSKGFTFDEATQMDVQGLRSDNPEQLEGYCEEREAQAERLNDLESRGFYHGTDNPHTIALIERGEQQQDLYDMHMNEY